MAEELTAAPSAKGRSETVELSRAERAVARRAAETRATIPHLELTEAARTGSVQGVQLTAALVRACALALRAQPRANASHRGDTIELHGRVNVGITITDAEIHVVPTLFDADRKDLAAIEAELVALRTQAMARALTPPQLAGATFTLSQTTALASAPLVIPPQAGALCGGAPRDGGVVLTLACDHRILYGARAEGFLEAVRANLEQGIQ